MKKHAEHIAITDAKTADRYVSEVVSAIDGMNQALDEAVKRIRSELCVSDKPEIQRSLIQMLGARLIGVGVVQLISVSRPGSRGLDDMHDFAHGVVCTVCETGEPVRVEPVAISKEEMEEIRRAEAGQPAAKPH